MYGKRMCCFVREYAILYKMTDLIVINIPHMPSFSPFKAKQSLLDFTPGEMHYMSGICVVV
jgi:hypothetical protein